MKMRKPSVEDMLNNKTTRYSLVMAVAKRARQIAAENAKFILNMQFSEHSNLF